MIKNVLVTKLQGVVSLHASLSPGEIRVACFGSMVTAMVVIEGAAGDAC